MAHTLGAGDVPSPFWQQGVEPFLGSGQVPRLVCPAVLSPVFVAGIDFALRVRDTERHLGRPDLDDDHLVAPRPFVRPENLVQRDPALTLEFPHGPGLDGEFFGQVVQVAPSLMR
jgi:hypothetical protein